MKCKRACSLVRYNWPLYLVCVMTFLIGLVGSAASNLPLPLRLAAACAAIVSTWFACASFLAFFMMFDRSNFLLGQWLTRCVDQSPSTCVQLSVCLEETTLPIKTVFPAAICTNLDVFDDQTMTEPAIARAKKEIDSSITTRANPLALPIPDGASELTVVTLAAHEIRNPRLRQALFGELSRITQSRGRVAIAEHLRNIYAACAFGPGMFHFYPHSEWIKQANLAGLRIHSEFDITPFIHIFVFEHDQA